MSKPYYSSSQSNKWSNLENFLHSVVPVVPSNVLPQSHIEDISNIWLFDDKDTVEYFKMEDLWRSFEEWSAYGVGTPIVLDHGKSIVQYYVPYLSAIQIYTTKTRTAVRNLGANVNASKKDIEFFGDDILANTSFKDENPCPRINRLGYLYFQYHDTSSPYWRVPLADKIMDFMPNYPRLLSLRSVDLSPASWMSIAWYPIYHIPTKWYVKDLATCFLTYHTLSSCFQDSARDYDYDHQKDVRATQISEAMEENKEKFHSQIVLPSFGLTTYKMQGDLWKNKNTSDEKKLVDLESAADSWLKQLDFYHHDFSFFKRNS
ncbi:uncharacterized protein LOC113752017 [Coffea eugenioides]|uniref:uncharacterized protein LOC113752017 n=1 Tax=Coffea eugenioides TaxID=49369 RepID=UPI000F60A61E|nr:uncharacterized protein LOC113752017 [Coffea eugenioides]